MLLIRVFIRHWTVAVESLVISLLRQLIIISAAGGNLFNICQKRSDGSFTDLVGISDYGSDLVSGGVRIFKENQKK